MSSKTYLQLVNAVFAKLREDSVTSVSTSTYSTLIGSLVNDAKREVEDAYNWNALSTTIAVITSQDAFSYALTDSGQRFRLIDAYNQTSSLKLLYKPTEYMNKLLLTGVDIGEPVYYNFNGVDANGDTMVDIYPVPNGVYSIYFNLIIPQNDLSADSDKLLIPEGPVILNAYARALVERGEDGGMVSSEAYALYKKSLADHIAIEMSRYPEESIWVAV